MLASKRISIAVDGPAGAGKSSISKVVAQKLGYLYIDTGAMYRAVTLAVLRAGVDPANTAAVSQILTNLTLRMEPTEEAFRVYLGQDDVTADIRTQAVNANVSVVAAQKAVRQYLVAQQREMALAGGVILDGRDIGSVVLPNADLKIYLTASVETRAKRRWLEMQDKESVSLAEVMKSVADRDEMDKNREESPLVCVPDAVVIKSDDLTFDETVDVMLKLVAEVANKA